MASEAGGVHAAVCRHFCSLFDQVGRLVFRRLLGRMEPTYVYSIYCRSLSSPSASPALNSRALPLAGPGHFDHRPPYGPGSSAYLPGRASLATDQRDGGVGREGVNGLKGLGMRVAARRFQGSFFRFGSFGAEMVPFSILLFNSSLFWCFLRTAGWCFWGVCGSCLHFFGRLAGCFWISS